jgi:hypothetical protein
LQAASCCFIRLSGFSAVCALSRTLVITSRGEWAKRKWLLSPLSSRRRVDGEEVVENRGVDELGLREIHDQAHCQDRFREVFLTGEVMLAEQLDDGDISFVGDLERGLCQSLPASFGSILTRTITPRDTRTRCQCEGARAGLAFAGPCKPLLRDRRLRSPSRLRSESPIGRFF